MEVISIKGLQKNLITHTRHSIREKSKVNVFAVTGGKYQQHVINQCQYKNTLRLIVQKQQSWFVLRHKEPVLPFGHHGIRSPKMAI